MAEPCEFTESQWADILFCIRATARRDSEMAEYFGPVMSATFKTRSARLFALAQEIVSPDEYGRRFNGAPIGTKESI